MRRRKRGIDLWTVWKTQVWRVWKLWITSPNALWIAAARPMIPVLPTSRPAWLDSFEMYRSSVYMCLLSSPARGLLRSSNPPRVVMEQRWISRAEAFHLTGSASNCFHSNCLPLRMDTPSPSREMLPAPLQRVSHIVHSVESDVDIRGKCSSQRTNLRSVSRKEQVRGAHDQMLY